MIIAIDGYSACGKSTLAKFLAKRLDYRFIDTGAMYRAITLFFQRHDVDPEDNAAVANALEKIDVDFHLVEGKSHVLLNGEDVESEIRSLGVSAMVSPVATVSAVRRFLVRQQRKMGARGRIVMDGRDIGTVVFPDADLKLFVTADLETRVDRRLNELRAAGKSVDRESVRANLLERDRIDSSRKDSPLRQAEDAILIDNTHLGFDEFLQRGLQLAQTAHEGE